MGSIKDEPLFAHILDSIKIIPNTPNTCRTTMTMTTTAKKSTNTNKTTITMDSTLRPRNQPVQIQVNIIWNLMRYYPLIF